MCLKENLKNIEHKTKDELANQILKDGQELIDILKESKLIEYELVRTQGKYNMLDEKARSLIGLSTADYIYIIEHYDELMNKYPNTKVQVQLKLDYIKSANIEKIVAIKGCNNCIEKVCEKLDVNIDDLCEECREEVFILVEDVLNLWYNKR